MNRGSHGRLPSARTEGLFVEDLGDEIVVFDAYNNQAHSLASIAAAVFANADGHTRVEELAERASSAAGEPVDVGQVETALAQLEERGLLAAPPSLAPGDGNEFSRRSFMRKTAATTAAVTAAPMITSVVTPAFGQANGTPTDVSCPSALCASQSEGDAFCACVNECSCAGCEDGVPPCDDPCLEAGDCASDAQTDCANISQKTAPCDPPEPDGVGTPNPCDLQAPKLESCECLNCSELTDVGMSSLCPTEPFTPCPSDSSPTNPGPGGCTDPNKPLDGRCFRRVGDSTETCFDPDCADSL